VTGAPASAAAYDRAVADYYGLTGDPVGALKRAVAADPGFALGGVGIAGLYMIGGFRADHPEVTDALAAARRAIGGATRREQVHLGAVQAWAQGRMRAAAALWEDVLLEHPTDALALRFVHDAYLLLGEPVRIRDAVARVLPSLDPLGPLTSFARGLYAFGLEETGDLARAERTAREALAGHPADAWAAHALAHVMETGCRQAEGIAFLEQSRGDWRGAHFMANHNGWHLALYFLEEGRLDRVLADYDRFVAPKLSDDATLDRVDAASLLWRLELEGVDVGGRWGPVAKAWMAHVDDHVLAFNDLHLALAAARSDDHDDVARLRRSLDDYARDGAGDNREVTATIGRKLIDGILAFADGDHSRAIEAILPVRYDCIRIGGSHAQRDVVALTLIAAAERAGRTHLVRALLAERAAIRPTPRAKAAHARATAIEARP
jgi:tetratricopeptide (TPR) repeat protein